MLPILCKELWLAGFAKHMSQAQPRIPPRIANEIAIHGWETLMMLNPADAVQTYLEIMKMVLPGDSNDAPGVTFLGNGSV